MKRLKNQVKWQKLVLKWQPISLKLKNLKKLTEKHNMLVNVDFQKSTTRPIPCFFVEPAKWFTVSQKKWFTVCKEATTKEYSHTTKQFFPWRHSHSQVPSSWFSKWKDINSFWIVRNRKLKTIFWTKLSMFFNKSSIFLPIPKSARKGFFVLLWQL